MIYHISFAARRPDSVARVLAELTGGRLLRAPTPLFPAGSWLVCFGDNAGSLIEVLPGDVVCDPGTLGGLRRTGASSELSGCHAMVGTPLDYEVVLGIARREGWQAQHIDNALFESVRLWVEGRFLLELIGGEQADRYAQSFGRSGLDGLDGKLRAMRKALDG